MTADVTNPEANALKIIFLAGLSSLLPENRGMIVTRRIDFLKRCNDPMTVAHDMGRTGNSLY